MKSKTLAVIITGFILLLSSAIVLADNLEEVVSLVCLVSSGVFLIYGVFASMHELIKITRDE